MSNYDSTNSVSEREKHNFEKLKLVHDNQIGYLRLMSDVDLRILIGYVTLQMAISAWIYTNNIQPLQLQIGIIIVDIMFAAMTGYFFYLNQKRREHSVKILCNVYDKLELMDGDINVFETVRKEKDNNNGGRKLRIKPWYKEYYLIMALSVLGFILIVLGAPNNS